MSGSARSLPWISLTTRRARNSRCLCLRRKSLPNGRQWFHLGAGEVREGYLRQRLLGGAIQRELRKQDDLLAVMIGDHHRFPDGIEPRVILRTAAEAFEIAFTFLGREATVPESDV